MLLSMRKFLEFQIRYICHVLNNVVICLYTIISNPNLLTIFKLFDQMKDPSLDDNNAEILDQITTYRGELKHRTVSQRRNRGFNEEDQETDIYL